jgi:hypothetical protein
MKTIIQLAIAALVINAAFQTARVYWDFYEFQDAIQQEALHGREATASQMHKRVLEIAAEHGIELAWGDVIIGSEPAQTSIDVDYEQPIPLAPGYKRVWPFKASVSARRIKPLTMDEAVR